MRILTLPFRALRVLGSALVNLLPGPPSDDSGPPDIDGRRPSETDLIAFRIDQKRKRGKGGYR
jgi:hypothetical protein